MPAAEKGMLDAKKLKCRNNLRQLWLLHKTLPTPVKETGGGYWMGTKSTIPELYECPLEGTRNEGDTDYRGPAGDVTRLSAGDPVGGCMGNHPDGSAIVLLKSGNVREVQKEDSLYQEALTKTSR